MLSGLKAEILNILQTHKQPGSIVGVAVAESPRLYINTSNVYRCLINGERKYVRLVKRHYAFREYVRDTVLEYYDINPADSGEICVKALKDIEDDLNLGKLKTNSRLFTNKKSNIVFDNAPEHYEDLGFPSLRDQGVDRWFQDFAYFLRGELLTYNLNKKLNTGNLQTMNANLQIATEIMADILGCKRLIPHVELYRIVLYDKEYYCTIMDEAEGYLPVGAKGTDRKKITRKFIRDMLDLEILDAICYQTDHKMGNYFVTDGSDGYIDGLRAFDNDSAFTFFPFMGLPHSNVKNPDYEAIVKHGRYNRKLFDPEIMKRIRRVKYVELKDRLKAYLTIPQIISIYRRICVIRNAFGRSWRGDRADLININKLREQDVDIVISKTNPKKLKDYLSYYLYATEYDF